VWSGRERRQGRSFDEGAFPVVAHGLLNSIAVVQGIAAMIGEEGENMSPAELRSWVVRMQHHTTLMAGVLQDVVRGIPSEVLVVLDDLAALAQPTS
jgi:hypothetical protein